GPKHAACAVAVPSLVGAADSAGEKARVLEFGGFSLGRGHLPGADLGEFDLPPVGAGSDEQSEVPVGAHALVMVVHPVVELLIVLGRPWGHGRMRDEQE